MGLTVSGEPWVTPRVPGAPARLRLLSPAMWPGQVSPNYHYRNSEVISFSPHTGDTFQVLGSSGNARGRLVGGYYSEGHFRCPLLEAPQHLILGALLAYGEVPASPKNPLRDLWGSSLFRGALAQMCWVVHKPDVHPISSLRGLIALMHISKPPRAYM